MNNKNNGSYVGTVTDQNWYKALYNLSPVHRSNILRMDKRDEAYESGFDFVYGLNRLPRIYLDEYISK